jgi:Nucleotide hydrolase
MYPFTLLDFLSYFVRYPLSNFTFRCVSETSFTHFDTNATDSTKEAQPEEDPSVSARLQRLQNNYEDFGMRRTVEGVLVVHDHGHPHILMLQIANAFFKLYVLLILYIFLPLT